MIVVLATIVVVALVIVLLPPIVLTVCDEDETINDPVLHPSAPGADAHQSPTQLMAAVVLPSYAALRSPAGHHLSA